MSRVATAPFREKYLSFCVRVIFHIAHPLLEGGLLLCSTQPPVGGLQNPGANPLELFALLLLAVPSVLTLQKLLLLL